jgi:hypothetical protein
MGARNVEKLLFVPHDTDRYFALMQHIILAVVTMSVVWYAWLNFKKLGRLRAVDLDLDVDQRQRLQMSYIMRIAMCLVTLAALPFLFTIMLKS